MSEDSRLIKVGHASLEVFDTLDQAKTDMGKLVELGCHMLAGTESGDLPRKTRLSEVLRDGGYRVFFPAQTDGWLAVKRNMIHQDWQMKYTPVIPSSGAINDPHPHDERGVVQVSWRHDTLGRITFITGHYLTLGRSPGQARQDDPNCHVDHVMWNRRLSNQLSQAAFNGSARDDDRGISFVTADTNLDDRTTNALRPGILTCWDELGKWPDTGHGPIDVIASVDVDKRVSCFSAKAVTDRDIHLATDHYPIVAQYRIKKILNRKAVR